MKNAEDLSRMVAEGGVRLHPGNRLADRRRAGKAGQAPIGLGLLAMLGLLFFLLLYLGRSYL